jgi:AdoMet-dependent heme synthase
MNSSLFKLYTVSLGVTDLCNQRCHYCYNYDRYMEKRYTPDVSTEELLQVIDLFADRQYLQLVEITGGEPFLRSDLLHIIDYIASKGLRVSIVSNASRVDALLAAQLARKKVSHVQTTFLASDAATHDSIAGEGSFATRKAGVQHLIAAGVPVIGAFVCTKVNYNLTGKTLEMMYAWGMREHIFFMRFCPSRFTVNYRDSLAVNREELRVALSQANQFGVTRGIKIHNKIPIPMCLIDNSDYSQIVFSSCGAAIEPCDCYIDQKGNVRLCASNAIRLGNIRSEKLDDLLWSDAAQAWKKTCVPDCSPCDLRLTCRGGCPVAESDPILNDVWVKKIVQFIPNL